MSVHAQLLEVLSDGNWHNEDDLRPITPSRVSGSLSFVTMALKSPRIPPVRLVSA